MAREGGLGVERAGEEVNEEVWVRCVTYMLALCMCVHEYRCMYVCVCTCVAHLTLYGRTVALLSITQG